MKKLLKQATTVCLILSVVATMTLTIPINTEAARPKPSVSGSRTITKGKSAQFSVKYKGKKVSAKSCKWYSTKKSVAKVSKTGRVYAKKAGTTYIYVKYKGRKSAKRKVTVKNPVIRPSVSGSSSIIRGKNAQFSVKYKGKKVSAKSCKWYSTKKNVATVGKTGRVYAKKAGTTYIYVKYKGKTSPKRKVIVKNPPAPAKPSKPVPPAAPQRPVPPQNPAPPVQPEKPKYTYKVSLLNPYKEIYTDNTSAMAVIFIKTNNPDGDSIDVHGDYKIIGGATGFDDLKGTYGGGNLWKVDGGYVYCFNRTTPGTIQIKIREIKDGCIDKYFYSDKNMKYAYETGASLSVTFHDYEQSKANWVQSLINKYTTSGMSAEDKFYAIAENAFTDFKYPPSYNGKRVTLLSEYGTIWQKKRLHSASAPELLVYIGKQVGYPVKMITYDTSDPLHAYVKTPDGNHITICPQPETGILDKIVPFDLSKY